MARYTNFFASVLPASNLREALPDVLQRCGLNMVYQDGDYIMAKEKPGHVAYSQLATVEVIIDSAKERQPNRSSTVNLVVKNEELPLKQNNHCRQIFQIVTQAIDMAS